MRLAGAFVLILSFGVFEYSGDDAFYNLMFRPMLHYVMNVEF